jgi:hypothetical protein
MDAMVNVSTQEADDFATLRSNVCTQVRTTERRSIDALYQHTAGLTIFIFDPPAAWSLPTVGSWEDTLWMQFALLYPHHEGYPGEDLRQREWQAEAVGEIMIAPRPAF